MGNRYSIEPCFAVFWYRYLSELRKFRKSSSTLCQSALFMPAGVTERTSSYNLQTYLCLPVDDM